MTKRKKKNEYYIYLVTYSISYAWYLSYIYISIYSFLITYTIKPVLRGHL